MSQVMDQMIKAGELLADLKEGILETDEKIATEKWKKTGLTPTCKRCESVIPDLPLGSRFNGLCDECLETVERETGEEMASLPKVGEKHKFEYSDENVLIIPEDIAL